MKTDLKIYTSFVSPLTLPMFIKSDLLPIFIIRNNYRAYCLDFWRCISETADWSVNGEYGFYGLSVSLFIRGFAVAAYDCCYVFF